MVQLDEIITAYNNELQQYFNVLNEILPIAFGLDPITQEYIYETKSTEESYIGEYQNHINIRMTERNNKNMTLANMISADVVQEQLNKRLSTLFSDTFVESIILAGLEINVRQKFIDIFYDIEYLDTDTKEALYEQTQAKKILSAVDVLNEDVIVSHIFPDLNYMDTYSFCTSDEEMKRLCDSKPYYRDRVHVYELLYDYILNKTLTTDDKINNWLGKLGFYKNGTIKITLANINKIIMIAKTYWELSNIAGAVRLSDYRNWGGWMEYDGVPVQADVYVKFETVDAMLAKYPNYKLDPIYYEDSYEWHQREYVISKIAKVDIDLYNNLAISNMLQIAEDAIYETIINNSNDHKKNIMIYVREGKIDKDHVNIKITEPALTASKIKQLKEIVYPMADVVMNYIKKNSTRNKKEIKQLADKYNKKLEEILG